MPYSQQASSNIQHFNYWILHHQQGDEIRRDEQIDLQHEPNTETFSFMQNSELSQIFGGRLRGVDYAGDRRLPFLVDKPSPQLAALTHRHTGATAHHTTNTILVIAYFTPLLRSASW